jgi:hypothetical protein
MMINRRDFAALTATATLTACGDGIDVAEWTEEVLLHDGRMLTVWRRARARSSGFPNANRGGDIDFELRFDAMGVKWTSTWIRSPLSFEVFDGVAHLALLIRDDESCARMAPTDYSAQFIKWEGGRWVEIRQQDFPTDRALLNLSGDYWGRSTADDYKGLITWSNKRLLGNRSPVDTIKTWIERGSRYCSRFKN